MNAINVASYQIRQFDGLFSLNDLYAASGKAAKHKPSNYLRTDQAIDLMKEIEQGSDVSLALKVVHGGQGRGTYACKYLVYAYAMWISAKFHLLVIRAFDEIYGNKSSPTIKRQSRSLPNGLTIEQQDTIKSLVKARVEALPPEKRAKAAITCWSSLKSKFGRTYKEIEPEHFTDAVSLVARIPLEGDFIPADCSEETVINGVSRNNIYCLVLHMEKLHTYWVKLSPALRALESKWEPRLHDHIHDGTSVARALRNSHLDAFNAEHASQRR